MKIFPTFLSYYGKIPSCWTQSYFFFQPLKLTITRFQVKPDRSFTHYSHVPTSIFFKGRESRVSLSCIRSTNIKSPKTFIKHLEQCLTHISVTKTKSLFSRSSHCGGLFFRSLIHHFLIESPCSLVFLFFPNLCWLQHHIGLTSIFLCDFTLFLLLDCTLELMLSECPTLWPQFTFILDLYLHISDLHGQNLELAIRRYWGFTFLTKKEK